MTAPHPLIVTLRRVREARGLSLNEADKRSQMSASTVGRWESGSGWPTVYGLERYAEALGMEVRVLPRGPSRLDMEAFPTRPTPPEWTPWEQAEHRRVLEEALKGFDEGRVAS